MSTPKHIIVLRFSAMGDVAIVVPVLKALTEQYSDLKITLVTKAHFKPLFKDIKNVEVFSADLEGKHKGILGLYKLSKELKRLKFDAIADLHHVLRSIILKRFFSGKKIVHIDKGRREKKALTSGKLFKQLKTTHQRYADVFKALGYPIDLSQTYFPEKAKLCLELKTFIFNQRLPLIGIAPFAAYTSKMYPLDKTETLISELSKDYNIVLFGGGDKETSVLNALEIKYKNVTSIAGKLGLEEELRLMSNLDIMLAMDSANGHLAAMLGVKVITIWGVTHPFAGFAPFNQSMECSILSNRETYPQIPTSVYGNKYPKNYEHAAGSISTDTILAKVRAIC